MGKKKARLRIKLHRAVTDFPTGLSIKMDFGA